MLLDDINCNVMLIIFVCLIDNRSRLFLIETVGEAAKQEHLQENVRYSIFFFVVGECFRIIICSRM